MRGEAYEVREHMRGEAYEGEAYVWYTHERGSI